MYCSGHLTSYIMSQSKQNQRNKQTKKRSNRSTVQMSSTCISNIPHIYLNSTFCATAHIHCVSVPLQELKETEELDIQLKVFNENKEEDSIELSHRLDDIRAEMEYPFVLIYR